jgi:hypothetical protein
MRYAFTAILRGCARAGWSQVPVGRGNVVNDWAAIVLPAIGAAFLRAMSFFQTSATQLQSCATRSLQFRSISSTADSSTFAPFAQSSHVVSSRGEWLTPPTLGTKIMPIGPTCAIICAS